MTGYDVLSFLLSGTALAVALFTAWIAHRQTNIARMATSRAAETTMDALYASLFEAYLAFPYLRAVFEEDEGPLGRELEDEERLRANAVAETMAEALRRALEMLDSGEVPAL